MGKWAEVYFTAAPERREEAVVELLRELEAGGAGAETAAKSETTAASVNRSFADSDFPAPDFSADDFATAARQSRVHCDACGHDNPATHQFCGMCGEKISSEDAAEDSRYARAAGRSATAFFDSPQHHQSEGTYSTTSSVDHEVAPLEPYGRYEDSDELSRLRKISTGGPSSTSKFDWDLEPTPSGHRHLYLAAGIVVIVLALVYAAWHGSLSATNAHQVSPAPPVALSEPERVPNGNADTPDATALRTQPAPALPAAKPINEVPETTRHQDAVASAVPANKTPAEPQPVASGNGSEELALAQRYLSGGTGIQRNSAEAAQWLWKSIAKHNSEAPILLADLYLRGDGVSKNCEQARVLLDSAARKGISGAGERLRNLQAFGCQ